MPVSRKGFKRFLRELKNEHGEARYTSNTVNSYYSGLNHLAHNLKVDIWQLTDAEKLENLVADCSPAGQSAMIGNYGNGTAFNALKQWIQYVEKEEGSNMTKCYLLTWNPENFKEGGDAGVKAGIPTRWSCHSQQPKIGDRIYLIRLGVEPRGIVASGTVVRESFADTDWRDPSKTKRYIEILPDETRLNPQQGMLSMAVLEQLKAKIASQFKWSAQVSGIEIPPDLATLLHAEWRSQEMSNMPAPSQLMTTH